MRQPNDTAPRGADRADEEEAGDPPSGCLCSLATRSAATRSAACKRVLRPWLFRKQLSSSKEPADLAAEQPQKPRNLPDKAISPEPLKPGTLWLITAIDSLVSDTRGHSVERGVGVEKGGRKKRRENSHTAYTGFAAVSISLANFGKQRKLAQMVYTAACVPTDRFHSIRDLRDG